MAGAGGCHPDVPAAMAAMSRPGQRYSPATGAVAATHALRFAAFERLQAAGRAIRDAERGLAGKG